MSLNRENHPVLWLWLTLGLLAVILLAPVVVLLLYHAHVKRRFVPHIARVFQEKPLFIIPRGQPLDDAENVRFESPDGLTLCGIYLRALTPRRRGVILFGLEYGSNRWACASYCQFLREAGFDIFTFEPRSQGDSDKQPGYEPLQWVTDYEVRDFQAALAYLKTRPDGDPRGIGFFGISKGGSAGVVAGSIDPFVRCFVTDGIFGTHSTMVPYMQKWVSIYSDCRWLQRILPTWFYHVFARATLRYVRRETGLRFPHVEHAMPRLAPRPLLMIHGGNDTYIKPEMAQVLHNFARPPRELWIVEGAKHNQALQVAQDEYRRRVLEFFHKHLAEAVAATAPAVATALEKHTPPALLNHVPRLCLGTDYSRGSASRV
jgi:pimeloyl-ACP methyl ester carboxylesterase